MTTKVARLRIFRKIANRNHTLFALESNYPHERRRTTERRKPVSKSL